MKINRNIDMNVQLNDKNNDKKAVNFESPAGHRSLLFPCFNGCAAQMAAKLENVQCAQCAH